MLILPVGSSLQQIAIRCWGIQFRPTDHQFLHRSHVFSTISKILSRSDEQESGSGNPVAAGPHGLVEGLTDITNISEIRVSSRQAMVASLNDNSTETFWESGDEDRNRGKWITLELPPQEFKDQDGYVFASVSVHIDNGRDLGNKVSSVAFKVGKTTDDCQLVKHSDMESRFSGWVTCFLSSETSASLVKIELKGPDNTLRVRQVRALGLPRDRCWSSNSRSPLPSPALTAESLSVLQSNCETETLRVFRLITGQVFGKLLDDNSQGSRFKDEEDQPQENYLQEHMVGILFSRSKLSHLQKQVCTHIVQAIEKETARFRDDWELSLCSGSPFSVDEEANSVPCRADNYCFEMLSLVLALSGSAVGCTYLAGQLTLVRDLLALLHTGSARVQRQVTALLRRVLPKVPPTTLADILKVPGLPPRNFGVLVAAASKGDKRPLTLDMHRMGIIDVFLACIAKALTLQVKTKNAKGPGKNVSAVSLASSVHPRASEQVGDRWWLRGSASKRMAEEVIALLKSLSSGKKI